MLAFLGVFLIGIAAPRAQTCSIMLTDAASEYLFRVQSIADGQGFGACVGTTPNTDPIPVLSMSCLAANGYGQWTLSTTPGQGSFTTPTGFTPGGADITIDGADEFPAGWYLLGNGLYAPSVGAISGDASHPECIPPGVVQCGSFSIPDPAQVKAVANLDGMAAFIWANPTGTAFVQSGFTSSDLDLTFEFLDDPTLGFMNVITNPIHTATSTRPWPNVSVGPQTITNLSGDWRDNFDVTADAAFIYIVWGFIPTPGAPEQIWVTAVSIGTATAPTGFPMRIPTGTDNCVNPTITCDPRTNRGRGTSPAFDIAYIDKTTNKIMVASFSGGVLSTPSPLSLNYWNPTVSSPGATESYVTPMHARIIRSSINGETSSLAVYATVCNGTPTANAQGGYDGYLLFYPPSNIFGMANYVAGPEMRAPSVINTFSQVIDHVIIAFADPYDNQSGWHSTDEFHCLYQYDIAALGVPNTQYYPLAIVRGSDIGAAFPLQPDGTTHSTCLVLNQDHGLLADDPTDVNCNYVAAVNQMGIHVHWRTFAGVHFYARDMNRTFDENIEENTLVTDQCMVSDGTSTGVDHGGQVGATLLNGLLMSLWTDPHYGPWGVAPGPGSTTSIFGLYSASELSAPSNFAGTLNLSGASLNSSNIAFNIGTIGWPNMDNSAFFRMMPNTFINFNPPNPSSNISFWSSGQQIDVNSGSVFNYAGLIAMPNLDGLTHSIPVSPFIPSFTNNPSFHTPELCSIQLNGHTASSGTIPALLVVRSGSDFFTPASIALNSYLGQISIFDGGSIFPPHSEGTYNSSVTGHMTLDGYTSLYESSVWAEILKVVNSSIGVVLSRQTVMTIDADSRTSPAGYQNVNFDQFQAIYSTFNNSTFAEGLDQGTMEIDFGHSSTGSGQTFDGAGFYGCNFDAAEIHVIDPPLASHVALEESVSTPISFEAVNSTFTDIRNKCIFIDNDEDPLQTEYGLILIDHDTFNAFAPDVSDADVSDIGSTGVGPHGEGEGNPFGIYLRGLDANDNPSQTQKTNYFPPQVTNNQFAYGSQWNLTLDGNASTDWGNNNRTNGAIALENSSAMVTGNTITDNGYSAGISIFGTTPPGYSAPPNTFSVICSNTIENIEDDADEAHFDGIGIESSFLQGPISLNTIVGNDIGVELFQNNSSNVTFNQITGNRELGLEVQGPTIPQNSFANMSDGACNTIIGEAEFASESEQEYPIILDGGGNIEIDDGDNDIEVSPTNATGSFSNVVIGSGVWALDVGDVDGNYWGSGVAPTTDGGRSWGSNVVVQNIDWTSTGVTVLQSQTAVPSGTTCPASTPTAQKTKKKSQKVLSSDSATCAALWQTLLAADSKYDWQTIYDTGKYYVETCYNNLQYHVFQFLGTAVEELYINDRGIYSEYNKWLESVLYLNTTDPTYFCAAVLALPGSIPVDHKTDTSEEQGWKIMNEGIAIDEWIIHNTDCDTGHALAALINSSRQSQYEDWLNDTLIPLDTTLPPLDSIQPGLLELLEKHFLYASVPENYVGILSNASAYPNPAGSGTVISFGISQEAYVKIEVYDVLGNLVSSAGFESLFEPGNKAVPISLAGLPSGTYFARIETAYGEAQTVKVVKQ